MLKNDLFQQLQNWNILSQFLHDLVELEPMVEFQPDLEEAERWSSLTTHFEELGLGHEAYKSSKCPVLSSRATSFFD